MQIILSDAARKQSIASIRRYFAEELDQDVGELKAGLMLVRGANLFGGAP